jgi:CspA family cold shock protein
MYKGKVKFFNAEKGFGFIMDRGSPQEFFVHVSGLIDEIKEDDDVTFDLADGPKGFTAVQVKVIS